MNNAKRDGFRFKKIVEVIHDSDSKNSESIQIPKILLFTAFMNVI